MDKHDYRNTTYCDSFSDVRNKKKELLLRIKENHIGKDMHTLVKKEEYKQDYLKVYNYKCSYCGASLLNVSINLMEIDHYIHEASFESKAEAGRIGNLVLACFACNRKKSSYLIKGKYKYLFYPDASEIQKVFIRGEDYGIKIADPYIKNDTVNKFYKQLNFNAGFRKLDFLLLNIEGLIKDPRAKNIESKLLAIQSKLLKKRNLMDVFK